MKTKFEIKMEIVNRECVLDIAKEHQNDVEIAVVEGQISALNWVLEEL